MKADSALYASPVFLILVFSAILRLYGLDRLSLWADELWVVIESTRGNIWQMLLWVYHYDNHPPGYYLLLRASQFVLGSSDYAIRLPSAIAGIALVAATFVAGRKHFSRSAAIIASALVAGSYQAVYYSQEARPNIFVALFSLLAFHYFRAVMLERDRAQKNYLLFWVFAALASYFHYAGLVFFLSLGLTGIAIIVIRKNKNDLQAGIWLFLPVLLVYLPWAFGTFNHLVNSVPEPWQRTPDMNTLRTSFRFLFGPDDAQLLFYQTVFFLSIAMLVVTHLRWVANDRYAFFKEDKSNLVLCLLTVMVLPVALFFVKSVFSQDAYNHRHFLYAIPLLALLAGHLVDKLVRLFPERMQVALLIIVVVFVMSYQLVVNVRAGFYNANHFKQEYREGARTVTGDEEFLKANGSAIVSSSYFFDHYLKRFTANQHQSDFIFDQQGKIAELQSFLTAQHIDIFYYLETPLIPAANKMITDEDKILFEHYQPLCRTRFARVQVFKFSTNNNVVKVDVFGLPDCRHSSP